MGKIKTRPLQNVKDEFVDSWCHLYLQGKSLPLQNTIIFFNAYVVVTSWSTRDNPFDHALSGPFDGLRSVRLSAFPTLCKCIFHRYLRINGFMILFDLL